MDEENVLISDADKELINENAKIAIEKSAWIRQMKEIKSNLCSILSERHHKMIKNYIDSEIGFADDNNDDDDECQKPLESDFKKGRISLAYENFKEFPKSLADILRIDITHLDLSMNDIQNFDFLKSFENLKALIVDGNTRMDTDTLPLNLNLELFYANKCEIEFPRSFVFRISVVFPNLKYFSMMDNPPIKRNEPFLSYDEAWLGREHRIRMLAIFIYPDLIHFNDKIITNLEREKSAEFHHYLGPVDSELEKFKSSVDTDNIVKILPVNLRDKALALLKIDETFDNDSDEGLVDVKISAYFASQDDNNISVASFFESKSKTKSKDAR